MTKIPVHLRILAALALWLALGIIAFLSGCRITEQHKDQRAYERVLGNDSLLAKVGRRISRQPDTVTNTVYVESTNTVQPDNSELEETFAMLRSDDSAMTAYLQSIVYHTTREIDTTYADGTRLRITRAGIEVKARKEIVQRRIVDRAGMEALQDSVDRYKAIAFTAQQQATAYLVQENAMQARAEAAESKLAELTKPKKGIPWWVWVLVPLVLAGVGIALAGGKLIPWVAALKIAPKLIGAFRKKDKPQVYATPNQSNGYYRLYPLPIGWQYQRVSDNNRALTTSQVYDDRSSALDGIQADRTLYNLPVREAKGPLPA